MCLFIADLLAGSSLINSPHQIPSWHPGTAGEWVWIYDSCSNVDRPHILTKFRVISELHLLEEGNIIVITEIKYKSFLLSASSQVGVGRVSKGWEINDHRGRLVRS